MNAPALLSFVRSAFFVAIVAIGLAADVRAAEQGNVPSVRSADAVPPEPSTNLAVELRVTPQLIEQIRREIEQSSARNAEAITSSLTLIEPALARMQQRQAEALQGAHQTILIIAGLFAALGFVALIVITLILVRALGRFSELAVAASPARRELGAGTNAAVLEHGVPAAPDSAVEHASNRFQSALEQLQRRILELEHGLQSSPGQALKQNSPAMPRALPAQSNGTMPPAGDAVQPMPEGGHGSGTASAESGEQAARAAMLLGKGQTLLNLGEAKEALACIEQALAFNANNPDALVKRGLALEQLEHWDDALESYNRALALDRSLTVAYLYKGGICNRLHRYQEALASYEQALQTERTSRAS